MGTRSAIGFAEYDGSIRAIYCHYDGYVEHNGKILDEYYNSIEAVEELLDMGDVVSLESSIEGTKFFGRDNKENIARVSAKDFKNVSSFYEYFSGCGCEYFYIFNGTEWIVAAYDGEFKRIGELLPA